MEELCHELMEAISSLDAALLLLLSQGHPDDTVTGPVLNGMSVALEEKEVVCGPLLRKTTLQIHPWHTKHL